MKACGPNDQLVRYERLRDEPDYRDALLQACGVTPQPMELSRIGWSEYRPLTAVETRLLERHAAAAQELEASLVALEWRP